MLQICAANAVQDGGDNALNLWDVAPLKHGARSSSLVWGLATEGLAT